MNRDIENSCPHLDTILKIISKPIITTKDKNEIKSLIERVRIINFELRNFS